MGVGADGEVMGQTVVERTTTSVTRDFVCWCSGQSFLSEGHAETVFIRVE